MSIILFAMIGAAIDANIAYWICFTIYAIFRTLKIFIELCEALQ